MKKSTAALLLLALVSILTAACASSQKRLEAQREKDPQYQYEKAVVCMNAGLTDYAIPYLNQALALDPRHAASLNLLGLAHMIKGNLPAAVAALEKCVEAAPAFSDGHNNLATALLESGQAERAAAEYRKAFELDENYNASFNLAKIEFQRGRHEAALEYVVRSLRKNNKSLLAFNLQGLILEALNRLDEAMASYEAALKIVPGELNVEFNLAVVYYKQEDFAKSRALLASILRRLRERTPAQAGDADLKKRVEDTLKRLEGRLPASL
jgi:tetratricopeptide (TPR) repeat protein